MGIAIDSSNDAYVTGATSSIDFPSASPFQANLPGGTGQHAFVSKLSTSGTTLVYSTYLGGSGSDTARAIAVDSAGVAHVVGYTTSANFPTANPIQNTYGRQHGRRSWPASIPWDAVWHSRPSWEASLPMKPLAVAVDSF